MKVIKFTIENYKALKGKHEFEPNGDSFFLIGGNGKGKTSAGQAMIDILTKKFPSQPVTEGEKEGYIEFTLDNESKLFAKFTNGKKPKVEFITEQGYKVGSPKELMADLAGTAANFNIEEFLNLAPKPRREMLERIQGIDMNALNEEEKEAMENRKLLKRQLKDQEARVTSYDKELVGKEPVKSNDLVEELETMNKFNDAIVTYNNRVESLDSEVEDIDAEIERLKTLRKEKNKQIKEIKTKLKDKEPYSQSKIDEVKEKLSNADDYNAKVEVANRIHKEAQQVRVLVDQVEDADNKVKEVRETKENLLQENPLPAEGLEWTADGDLLLDGLPFESNQIATSRKVIAGLQIAETLLGDIKYIHFDASVLDKDSADEVVDWAEEKGLQLCLERALWEGGELKFEVVDNS